MPAAKKISTRKVLQVALTLVVTIACVVALSSTVTMQQSRRVRQVRFIIANAEKCQFLSEDLLRQMLLRDRNYDPTQSRLSDLNLRKIESIIQSNPWVADAQVYLDSKSVLYINVMQRVPLVRLFQADGDSYYLDSSLRRVPLSDQYVHLARVVSNVPLLRDDSAGNSYKGMLVGLCARLDRDSFWNAQVSEVHCTDEGQLELISVLGNHRIIIGDTASIDRKLANTLRFYKQVLNRVGWDRYQTLDLRFAGQVVAGPSVPVYIPRDKALSDMNWVKSILGSDYHDSMIRMDQPTVAAALRDTHRASVQMPVARKTIVSIRAIPATTQVTPAPRKIIVAPAPRVTTVAKQIAAPKQAAMPKQAPKPATPRSIPAATTPKSEAPKTEVRRLPNPGAADIPRPAIHQQMSGDDESPAQPAPSNTEHSGRTAPKYIYPGRGQKKQAL